MCAIHAVLEIVIDEGQLLMVLEGDNLTACVSFSNTSLDRNVSIQFFLQSDTATGISLPHNFKS